MLRLTATRASGENTNPLPQKRRKPPTPKKTGRKLNVKTTNLHIVCEFAFTVHGKIEMMASNMLQEDFSRIVLLRS